MRLRIATSPAWTAAVLADLDAFLVDHAANERKASASALALVAHYPDRAELVERLIALSIEELEHFRAVTRGSPSAEGFSARTSAARTCAASRRSSGKAARPTSSIAS